MIDISGEEEERLSRFIEANHEADRRRSRKFSVRDCETFFFRFKSLALNERDGVSAGVDYSILNESQLRFMNCDDVPEVSWSSARARGGTCV
jgi:hypothetical protein